MKRPELLVALSLCVGLALGTGASAQGANAALKQLADQLEKQRAEKAQLEQERVRLRQELADRQVAVDRLTEQLQTLRHQVAEVPAAAKQRAAEPTTAKRQYRVFTLKNAQAVPTAELLRGLLPEDQAKAVRIMPDPRTNSVVVNASAADLEEIEAVIAKLDQLPGVKPAPPPDKTP